MCSSDLEKLARETFGDRMAYVPYTIPGFALAKSVAEICAANPKVKGLVLLRHGIFTFAEDARTAYELMIEMVTMAEVQLKGGTRSIAQAKLPAKLGAVAEIAPTLRGAVALSNDRNEGLAKRQILCFRSGEKILNYVNGAELKRYSQVGVATPDHTIRTKNWPLVVPAPDAGKLDQWSKDVHAAVNAFIANYHAYFALNNERVNKSKKELDPFPRVILVPGVGLFGLGASAKDAAIAADIAENTVEVITAAESMSRYQCISEADQFDVEYWSLEQAKLGKAAEKKLARQVAIVTGGGSGIGAATAKAMAREGAEVAVLDRDADAAARVAKQIGGAAIGLACDVTKPDDVRRAFDAVAEKFGGADIVVSNAGAAWQGRIGEVDDETLRKSFELNFFAHQSVAQNAVRIMKAQGTGGCLLFNTSKQAVDRKSTRLYSSH